MTAPADRRRFLTHACALAFGTGTPALSVAQAAPTTPDVLFGGCRYQTSASAPQQFALARVQVASGAVGLAASPFFPHGWALAPDRPNHAYFFEKEGPGAGLFDLVAHRWVQAIAPVAGRRFYGHGVVVGDRLLSTESAPDGTGAIGIRDTRSLRYLGDFPTHGQHPHDCHLVDGGKTLVVSNGGGPVGSAELPSVAFIDVASQRLLHRHTMPDPRFNTGHLAPVSAEQAVVVSAPRRGLTAEHPGSVSLCLAASADLRLWKAPDTLEPALLGEALSVVVLPRHNLVAVTHPTPGWLTFWQLSTGQFVRSLRAPHVRGLALARDGEQLWITHGAQAELGRLSLKRRDAAIEPVLSKSLIAGSHLLNLPLPLSS